MKKEFSYVLVFIAISILTILVYSFTIKNSETNKAVATTFTIQVKPKGNNWIYEIYDADDLFIRQEYIPAVKGKQVFKTKDDAEKIGNLVMSKLSKNAFPVVSTEDLVYYKINFEKI